MNLSDLIELSEKDKRIEKILDIAVERIFGDSKPLTEILKEIEDGKQDKGI